MKSTDIKVGEFYSYQAGKWGLAKKVLVMEVTPYKTGYRRYSPATGGIKIDMNPAEPGIREEYRYAYVRPQTIQCTWEEQERKNKASEEYRIQDEQRKSVLQAEYAIRCDRLKELFARIDPDIRFYVSAFRQKISLADDEIDALLDYVGNLEAQVRDPLELNS